MKSHSRNCFNLKALVVGCIVALPAFANLQGKWKGDSFEADPKFGKCHVDFSMTQTKTEFTIGSRKYICEFGKSFEFEEVRTEIRQDPKHADTYGLWTDDKKVGEFQDIEGLGGIFSTLKPGGWKTVFWLNSEDSTQLWWAEENADFEKDGPEIDLRKYAN